ncbi:hypothetical protein PF005_g24798 [Phytophthora fragariae]|uniref:RxLR effector protein n=1 Tax=Phytophthora fragariae TaxID=53985 RepID=A0A6A3H6Y7_9STRA|nr:hypothetical protein PF009_g23959 [Phytophthora fragariae]KAE8965399.1 hypothetical protein PF011_g28304 [Phytophthora fragariae]KAE9071808.1 hypothetical protein PF010_g25725 [Phytophthora fragariae]KAE9095268.1 hypothetical protein PF006_g24058 [Phytophthora fragariae]KAE9176720.1 hypothetical protein PF005_g24798 [Phytophthora fragariae]
MKLAMSGALWLGTAATTYRLPLSVTGSGPATSSAQRSPASPTPWLRSGGITSFALAFLVPQSRHDCTQRLTHARMSGHQ